jgi:hypothetical protein
MIRNWDANETGPLLELWLESTIHAHPFIAESYWHDSWRWCAMFTCPPRKPGYGSRTAS